jgi:hypothetical protein
LAPANSPTACQEKERRRKQGGKEKAKKKISTSTVGACTCMNCLTEKEK